MHIKSRAHNHPEKSGHGYRCRPAVDQSVISCLRLLRGGAGLSRQVFHRPLVRDLPPPPSNAQIMTRFRCTQAAPPLQPSDRPGHDAMTGSTEPGLVTLTETKHNSDARKPSTQVGSAQRIRDLCVCVGGGGAIWNAMTRNTLICTKRSFLSHYPGETLGIFQLADSWNGRWCRLSSFHKRHFFVAHPNGSEWPSWSFDPTTEVIKQMTERNQRSLEALQGPAL